MCLPLPGFPRPFSGYGTSSGIPAASDRRIGELGEEREGFGRACACSGGQAAGPGGGPGGHRQVRGPPPTGAFSPSERQARDIGGRPRSHAVHDVIRRARAVTGPARGTGNRSDLKDPRGPRPAVTSLRFHGERGDPPLRQSHAGQPFRLHPRGFPRQVPAPAPLAQAGSERDGRMRPLQKALRVEATTPASPAVLSGRRAFLLLFAFFPPHAAGRRHSCRNPQARQHHRAEEQPDGDKDDRYQYFQFFPIPSITARPGLTRDVTWSGCRRNRSPATGWD